MENFRITMHFLRSFNTFPDISLCTPCTSSAMITSRLQNPRESVEQLLYTRGRLANSQAKLPFSPNASLKDICKYVVYLAREASICLSRDFRPFPRPGENYDYVKIAWRRSGIYVYRVSEIYATSRSLLPFFLPFSSFSLSFTRFSSVRS